MQVNLPKMKDLTLLEAVIDYDFDYNYSELYIEAKDKKGTLWKFEKYEINKYYRNRKGQDVTDTYYMSDLKKSNKANSYRKFFSRLTKKLPEVLTW